MNGQDEPETSGTDAAPAPTATVEIFRCKQCGREFAKAQALQTHEIRAHKKFWTTNTKRTVGNKRYEHYRDQYRAKGLNAKGRPYKRGPRAGRVGSLECPVCHVRLASRVTLGVHVRHVHGKSMRDFQPNKVKCPICPRTFVSGGNLGMHMSRVHGQSLKQYRNGETMPARGGGGRPKLKGKRCPVCQKKFKTRPLMTHHLRNVHGKSITEFQARGGRPLERQEAAPEPERRIISTPQATHEARNVARQKEGREIIFCPVCGTNIHAVRTAVNFADQ